MSDLDTDSLYDDEPRPPSNRSVGFVFAGFFCLLSLVFWYMGKTWHWSVAISAGFALLALAWPGGLGPLNRVWMKFGLLLHNVTNPIVLGALFYLVVLPVGLLRRVGGADPLRLRRRSGTYWIDRPEGEAASDFKDPF